MDVRRWIRIVAVAAATAGLAGVAISNEPGLTNQSATDVNANSAAQLGADKSATPHRSGDRTAEHGSENPAGQMGSGVNANPGAQLNNDASPTSAPPVDSARNTPGQATTSSDVETKSSN